VGAPLIKIVTVSHPLGGLSREEVCRKAEAAFDTIVKTATG